MPELATFQDAFCDALRGDARTLAPWVRECEPAGLSVYRNTVAKGAIDALAAIYPTVVQLVGEDWFRAAAAAYTSERPPAQPSLLGYGSDFPAWLAAFAPAQDTPYLADVTRLDRLWNAAYFATDAEPLPPAAFATLGEPDLANFTGRLHPSAGLAAFGQNIVSLWLAHRAPKPKLDSFELADTAERVLVVRPALAVEVRSLEPAAYAFLEACAGDESLLAAAERALAADPAADLPQIIADALAAGAFAGLDPLQGRRSRT